MKNFNQYAPLQAAALFVTTIFGSLIAAAAPSPGKAAQRRLDCLDRVETPATTAEVRVALEAFTVTNSNKTSMRRTDEDAKSPDGSAVATALSRPTSPPTASPLAFRRPAEPQQAALAACDRMVKQLQSHTLDATINTAIEDITCLREYMRTASEDVVVQALLKQISDTFATAIPHADDSDSDTVGSVSSLHDFDPERDTPADRTPIKPD